MADIETAIKDLEEIKDKLIPTISRMYGSGFSSVFACEKAEEKINNAIELLKEQKNLVNVDKLREKLGFAESCEKCKNDSWRCQRDAYFTEMDFCGRLDSAIEELIKGGQ